MMNTQQRHASPLAPAPLSELPPRTFETERLTLRAMEREDAELVYKTYASDPVVTRYLSFPRASHPDDSRPFVDGIADNFAGKPGIHTQYGWLVFRKDSGECIGCVGFGIKDASSLSGGYVFAQSAWGHGFATEAWRPVVEWGKSQPNVQRIEADHHPDNPASGNVMRKLGLIREGVIPDFCVLPNLGPQRVEMVIWAWTRPFP